MVVTGEPAAVGRVPLDADLLCYHCHQNLRGVPDGKCPECGRAFDRGITLASTVPWQQRRTIGWPRAYLRTMYMVVRRPRELIGYARGPMSFAATRSFQRVNAALATLPFLGGLAFTAWASRTIYSPTAYIQFRDWPSLTSMLRAYEDCLRSNVFLGVTAAASYAWLRGLTGLAGILARFGGAKAERPASVAAGGAYASGPLAWVASMGLVTMLGALPQVATVPYADLRFYPSLTPHVLLVVGLPSFWLVSWTRFLGRCAGASRARRWALALTLAVGGVLWTVVTFATAHVATTLVLILWATSRRS